MTTFRRRDLTAVCVGGAFVLSGCGGLSSDVAPAAGAVAPGEITVAGCVPARPLVPSNVVDTCGGTILDAVTARLLTYDRKTGKARNDLAASVTTRDAKKFTITVRADARYSDGTSVRAADFVRAWNYAAYGRNNQAGQYLLRPIAGFNKVAARKPKATTLSGLKVTGERSFTVTLGAKNSAFVQRLGMLAFAPLPPSFFADKGAAFRKVPMGAGPYKVLSGTPTTAMVLGANPNYTGPTPPSIERITVKQYTDPFQAYDDLVANRIDLLNFIPGLRPAEYEPVLGDRVIRSPSLVMQTISFPPKSADASYANPKLRRAISMAIDRPAVIRSVYGRTASRATGWAPLGAFGADTKGCGSVCVYDSKKARALFKEAGGHVGALRIAYNPNAGHDAWVRAVCRSITKTLPVGCKPSAASDFASFRARIDKGTQKGMFRTGWQADYPSIENFLSSLYATGGEGNDARYSSAKFDALLAKAAATPDLTKANGIYRQAERLLRGAMPAIPLWSPVFVGARSTKVASASFNVYGTYDLTTIVLA